MKTKTSKVQLAVWDAKERLSAELLKLPVEERIPYIISGTKDIVEGIKRKRKLNQDKVLFPEKVAKANEMLKTIDLPKRKKRVNKRDA